jgi:hypothetical protein
VVCTGDAACQDPNSGRAMGARCPRLAAERSHTCDSNWALERTAAAAVSAGEY